jgi:hypothetical protein
VRIYTAEDNRGPLLERNGEDAGTAWNDMIGSVQEGGGVSALTTEALLSGSPFLATFFRHDQNDALSFAMQLPHAWAPGTDVRPHLHVLPCAAPGAPQVARFQITYAWSRVGEVMPAAGAWTTRTADLVVGTGDLHKQRIVDFGLVTPPADAHESAVFLWHVQRLGTDPGDTYTTGKGYGIAAANVAVLSVDVHYQIEKAGTATEFPEA